VCIDGVSKDVSCEHSGDGFLVHVEEREYILRDVSRTEDTLSFFAGTNAHTIRFSLAADGVWLSMGGRDFRFTEAKRDTDRPTTGAAAGDGKLEAPMPGNVVSVNVSEGERISAGTPVAVIESMKMMNEVTATADGVVRRVHCRAGQHVGFGDLLVEITDEKAAE
jgi:acetyl-CoA/propionyl-CoA carboxylase biotin carboxyl carrier protein